MKDKRALAARRKKRQLEPRLAPGDLAIVQAFLNTRSSKVGDVLSPRGDQGGETLSGPSELSVWLAARGLLASDVKLKQRHLKRALAVRRGLHALVVAHAGGHLDVSAVQELDEASKGARIEVRFDGEGAIRLAAGSVKFADALARLLGMVAVARFEGTWPQLKACADRECGAAFFDARGLGTWCSQRCGERMRTRARRRGTG